MGIGIGMLRLPMVYLSSGGRRRAEQGSAARTAPRARHFSKSPRYANIGHRSWAFLVPGNFRVKKALPLSPYIHLAEEAYEFPARLVPPLPPPSSPRPFSFPSSPVPALGAVGSRRSRELQVLSCLSAVLRFGARNPLMGAAALSSFPGVRFCTNRTIQTRYFLHTYRPMAVVTGDSPVSV